MRRTWQRAVWLFLITGVAAGCEEKPREPTPPPAEPAPPPAPPPAAAPSPQAQAEEGEVDEVAAQHVLIAFRGASRAAKDVTRSKSEAKKLAQEVLAKAKAGEDFSKLAADYSDCPSKANRGNLGKFNREAMAKPFSDAVFALKVNAVSDVVETKFGFHIIKRNQ